MTQSELFIVVPYVVAGQQTGVIEVPDGTTCFEGGSTWENVGREEHTYMCVISRPINHWFA